MSEGINFAAAESDSGDDDDKKKERARKVAMSAFAMHNEQRREIEKVGGDTPVESRKAGIFLRNIEPEMQAAGHREHEVGEPKSEEHQPQHHAEHDQFGRVPTPEELANLAARDAQAELFAHHLQELESKKAEDDEEDEDKPKSQASHKPAKPKAQPEEIHEEKPAYVEADHLIAAHSEDEQELVEEANAEAEPAHDEFEDVMNHVMSAEFAASTSGEKLSNEAAPEENVAHNAAEAPVQEAFESSAPPRAAHENQTPDDQTFQDMIERDFGKRPPNEAKWQESDRGELPTSGSGEGANIPPNPPTAEGGMWENSGWPKPDNMHFPSGATMDALTAAGVAGLSSKRERFDSMRHTITEAMLLGGELLLAAGLVGEHFARKHQARKHKHELQKHAKAIKHTQKMLQQQQKFQAHQSAKVPVEQMMAGIPAQGVMAEQLSKTAANSSEAAMAPTAPVRPVQAGEASTTAYAAEAGAFDAVAAEVLAHGSEKPAEASRQSPPLEAAKESNAAENISQAINANSEYRAPAEAAIAPAAEIKRAEAAEQREPAGTQAEAPGAERNFEKLQDPLAGKTAQAQNSSGGAPAVSAAQLAPQKSANDTSDEWPSIKLDALADARPKRKSRLTNPWTFVIIFFFLALILAAYFITRYISSAFG